MAEHHPSSPTSHFMEAIKAIEAGQPHVALPEAGENDLQVHDTLVQPGSPDHITLPVLAADLTPGNAKVDFREDLAQELRVPEEAGPIALKGAEVTVREPEDHPTRANTRFFPVITKEGPTESTIDHTPEQVVKGEGLTSELREFFENSQYDGPAIQSRMNTLNDFYHEIAEGQPGLHEQYGFTELPHLVNKTRAKLGEMKQQTTGGTLADKYTDFLKKNGVNTEADFDFDKMQSDPEYRANKAKVLEFYYKNLIQSAETLRQNPELGMGNYVLTDKDSKVLWMARDISFRGMTVTHISEATPDGTLTSHSSSGIHSKNIPLDRLYPVKSEDEFADWQMQ